jgi:hypothetical protein
MTTDYDAACHDAASAQGLDPVMAALDAYGVASDLEDLGYTR